MKFIISENKVESLKQIAQYLIDNELNNLRIMSDEEWGMGEMDEINEVSSIDKIIVHYKRISSKLKKIFTQNVEFYKIKEIFV